MDLEKTFPEHFVRSNGIYIADGEIAVLVALKNDAGEYELTPEGKQRAPENLLADNIASVVKSAKHGKAQKSSKAAPVPEVSPVEDDLDLGD